VCSSDLLPRRGNKIYPWDQYKEMHTMLLANKIVATFHDLEAHSVGVDSIGVGGGVIDWLQHDPRGLGVKQAFGVNVAEAATDNRKHHRLRDMLWDKVRLNCMTSKYSFPDSIVRRNGVDINLGHELANELSSVRYNSDRNGAIQIESKREMKSRGVSSPNIADALCISEYINPMSMALWGRSAKAKERPYDRSRPKQQNLFSSDSWMVT
jgi:phage terminase large subunit